MRKVKSLVVSLSANCHDFSICTLCFTSSKVEQGSYFSRSLHSTLLCIGAFENNVGNLGFAKGQLLAAVLVVLDDMTDVVQFFHQMQKFPSEFQILGNVSRTPKNIQTLHTAARKLLLRYCHL